MLVLWGSLRDREVACSASDRQGSNFESCVWRTVSSQSSHHPQEVLLAQFSLYVHKGGLKPDSFHFLPQLRVIIVLRPHKSYVHIPANTKHVYNFCTTSVQRLRRWSNIVLMLHKCFVFTGMIISHMNTATNTTTRTATWTQCVHIHRIIKCGTCVKF